LAPHSRSSEFEKLPPVPLGRGFGAAAWAGVQKGASAAPPIAAVKLSSNDRRSVPEAAVSRCSNVCVQKPELLDHLVGTDLQHLRHGQTKRLGGLEVDR
jgi:hypothetical protein